MDDFVADFARRGYVATFRVQPGGRLRCSACERAVRAEDVVVRSLRRVEGASDPDDMAAVLALECPACHARGTATLAFGARSPRDDGEVLRLLQHGDRPSRRLMEDEGDASLVRDSGWLRGPKRG